MKSLFILLIVPVLSIGQTVHIKDDKIVYEGKEKVTGISATELANRIRNILPSIISDYKIVEQSTMTVKARGKLKLKTPYSIIRTVPYSIELRILEDGYEYQIDSVSFSEQKRGEKMIVKSSKEVLENMEETQPIIGEAERMLNEADMKFQKLLDFLRSGISKV